MICGREMKGAGDMGVSHGRSRVGDLVFQVYSRSLHPDWFLVREFRRVIRNGWEADIRIIEGGHAVIFRAGGTRLTEVVASPDTVLPESGLIFHSPIKHERSTTIGRRGGAAYQTCFEVERVDEEVFAHLCMEMTLDGSHERLFHRDAPVNRMAPAPITHLRYEAMARGLSVHTFQTFPEERAIVRTQSLFEAAGIDAGR